MLPLDVILYIIKRRPAAFVSSHVTVPNKEVTGAFENKALLTAAHSHVEGKLSL